VKSVIGFILAALSVIGFASTFIIGAKLTKDCEVSAAVLSFLRFTIAGLVMLVLGLATKRERKRFLAPTGADWLKLAWLGAVGTVIMAWCVFMGCARVSAANASMADALTPLMIFAVAALRSWHIEGRELVGLGCGLLGALLVVQVINAGGIALEAYTIGDVYILLSAATWGIYTVYGRELINRLGSLVFTAWTMLLGAAGLGIVLAVLTATRAVRLNWPSTTAAWLLSGALGLVSTLLPFWTWNAAQKYLPMAALGISAYFTPVVAVAMAIIFLHESATALQWLGALFIIASAMVEHRQR